MRRSARRLSIMAVGLLLTTQTALPAEPQAPSVEVREAVAPEYPDNACGARFGGRVTVELTALPDGGLGSTRAEGSPLLQAAAIPAALSWRFVPPSVAARVRLTFIFTAASGPDGGSNRPTTVFRPPYEVEVRCQPRQATNSVPSR